MAERDERVGLKGPLKGGLKRFRWFQVQEISFPPYHSLFILCEDVTSLISVTPVETTPSAACPSTPSRFSPFRPFPPCLYVHLPPWISLSMFVVFLSFPLLPSWSWCPSPSIDVVVDVRGAFQALKNTSPLNPMAAYPTPSHDTSRVSPSSPPPAPQTGNSSRSPSSHTPSSLDFLLRN